MFSHMTNHTYDFFSTLSKQTIRPSTGGRVFESWSHMATHEHFDWLHV